MVEELIELNVIYNRIAKEMLKELFKHLKDKPIVVQVGDLKVTVTISDVGRISVREKENGD